tara:strand:- start:28702 stop:28869 length:168 start_codon:yes stop_codon:yes gene_type:complete
MKLLNDLFSLLSGTGKREDLEDMVEGKSPLRVIALLIGILIIFLVSVSLIVSAII